MECSSSGPDDNTPPGGLAPLVVSMAAVAAAVFRLFTVLDGIIRVDPGPTLRGMTLWTRSRR